MILGSVKLFLNTSKPKTAVYKKIIIDLTQEGFIQFERLPHNLKASQCNTSY